MTCPVDSSALEPVVLSPTITVHRCAECCGIWVTFEAFRTLTTHFMIGKEDERLYDTHEQFTKKQPDATVEKFHRGDDSRYPCPEGHGMMSEHRYAGDSGVFIDQCPVCHGLWLDVHELAHIREHLTEAEEREAVARAYAKLINGTRAADEYEREKALFLMRLPVLLIHPVLFLTILANFVKTWMREQERRAPEGDA